MKLEGQSVLITGASRGLGRALAIVSARKGARVALVARESRDLTEVEALIRREGGIAHAIPADVSDKRSIYPIAAQAAELCGPVSILVNNASTLGDVPLRLLLDTDCEKLEEVLQTNLVAPFRLTKAVAGNMLVRGRGIVINLSSDAAVEAYPTWGPYSASKAALDHLTRVLGAELKDTPVRFWALDPGEMDTRMHADAIPDADRSKLRDPAEVAQRIVSMIELEDLPTGERESV
jgi:NAD(P)-dependent dehydrogenase (short-subunit alcohol dehydrogenase family)